MTESKNSKESFIYLWRDTKSKTKKFYLGKHKGSPDDDYTHSSTVMEKFDKSNWPSHMKRRILCYGSDVEMCELEKTLLKSRHSKGGKCWDRYYNISVGIGPVDQWAENNPRWNHGGVNLNRVRKYNREWKVWIKEKRYFKELKLECSKRIRKKSYKSPYSFINELDKDSLISLRKESIEKRDFAKREAAQLEYKIWYEENPEMGGG